MTLPRAPCGFGRIAPPVAGDPPAPPANPCFAQYVYVRGTRPGFPVNDVTLVRGSNDERTAYWVR